MTNVCENNASARLAKPKYEVSLQIFQSKFIFNFSSIRMGKKIILFFKTFLITMKLGTVCKTCDIPSHMEKKVAKML